MNFKIYLFFLFVFVQNEVFSQVNFWHVSAEAEKTISDVGYQNMQAAWFVTGADTIYTYRFLYQKNVSRKTLWDSDSTWKNSDSLYHKYLSLEDKSARLTVYYKGRAKRQFVYELNKLQSSDHWQRDSLGKEIYHRQWSPRKVHTTIKHVNGMVEWLIEDLDNDSKTLRKQHADTNRVWVFLGKDTVTHSVYWKNYSEKKRYQPLYLTREWWDGVKRTSTVSTAEYANSVITNEQNDMREIWEYHSKALSQKDSFFVYTKEVGLKRLKSKFEVRPQSDTARYTIEKHVVLKNGLHRKAQVLRLKKDSTRYRQIDFYWKANGELDYLKTTNRWEIKRKRSPARNYEMDEPIQYHHTTRNSHFLEQDPIGFRFEVLSKGLSEIKIDNKSLDYLIYQKLVVRTEKFEDVRVESILFEIDAIGKLGSIRRSPNAMLYVSDLKREIGVKSMQLPRDLKTTFYYTDTNGKKHTRQMKYTLLPVTVLIRRY